MKKITMMTLLALTTLVYSSCDNGGGKDIGTIVGCMDRTATNFNPSANQECANCCVYPKKSGGVLFWTNDPFVLTTCGVITIKLNNGQQVNITGYYFTAPANCVNLFGGYIYLEEGTYTYQVFTPGACLIAGGTITVVGDRCNLFKI